MVKIIKLSEPDLGLLQHLKMERFVIIVNGFQPLTIITKRSILDIAAVLDSPLIIYDSNKRNGRNNNNNNSKQSNDADIDFAIIQMKELIENVKNLQATYQEVFNISDTLQ